MVGMACYFSVFSGSGSMPLLPGFSISFLLATVRIGIGKYIQGYPRVILAVDESILRLL